MPHTAVCVKVLGKYIQDDDQIASLPWWKQQYASTYSSENLTAYMVHRVPHDLAFTYHMDFISCWFHSNYLCLLVSTHRFSLLGHVHMQSLLEFSLLISSHTWTPYIIWISSPISPLQRGQVWSVYIKHSPPHLPVTVFILLSFLHNSQQCLKFICICLFICLLAVLSTRMYPLRAVTLLDLLLYPPPEISTSPTESA